MMDDPGIGNIRNLLNNIKPASGLSPIKAGAIIKATVVDVTEDGDAFLRLLSGGFLKGNMKEALIKARADVPLTKGQTVFLELLGSKENMQLKLIGETENNVEALKQNSSAKLLDMILRLSGSGLSKSESRQLLNMLKALPQNIKNDFPELNNLTQLLQDGKLTADKLLTAGSVRSLLTVMAQAGKSFSPATGTVLKAEVLDITGKENAVLRLIASDSSQKNVQGTVIKAQLAVPLTNGQNVFLEVLGGDTSIKMRLVSGFSNPAEVMQNIIPAKYLNMLAQLSESRLGSMEFHQLFNMLKSLPHNIKATIPEFQSLEKLLLDIKQIEGKDLKAFVERSGVAFETRLKIAVLNDGGSMIRNLMALQNEGDLKSLLMKLKELLKDENVVRTLTEAGHKISEVSSTVEKFIRNIEFFQLTSKVDDMFYTFLPVLWDDLKDGEFLFRKNRGSRKGSYTCDINLDFESLGKLSISVTVLNSEFYITFSTEKKEVKELISSQKHLLESRFVSQGLPLKAININQKNNIQFGETLRQGVNVKI
jgi:hypothetical protein